jgi:hypothetical protein
MGIFVAVGSSSSNPGIHAYDFTSVSGWGTKFAAPTSALGTPARRIAFSTNKDFVAISTQTSPYVHSYAFSSTGFGTKVSNPSTLIPSGGQDLALNSGAVAINAGTQGMGVYPITVSGFGTRFTNPTFAANGVAVAFSPNEDYIVISASNLTPYIHAWAWSNSTGFGTKVSNPATNPGAQPRRITFSRDGAQIAVAHPSVPYAYAWRWSGGFGTRINPIGITLAGQGQSVSFGNSSAVFAASTTNIGGLRGGPWSSSGFASTSVPPSTTAPWPAGGGQEVQITKLPNKVFSSFQSDVKPYAMSWNESYGFNASTTLYSAPSTLPNSTLLTIAASKEDYVLISDVTSFLFTGIVANLTKTTVQRKIICDVGTFALAGQDATLTKATSSTNANATGSIGTVALTALAGSGSGGAATSGAIATITISALAGSGSGTATTSGSIGTLSIVAVAGTASGGAATSGVASTVTLAGPTGSGAGTATTSGQMATVALVAMAGAGSGTAATSGAIGTITITALAGSGTGTATTSGLNGTVAITA